jgi:cellulose biosynthesis protein BcsQ
MPYIHFDEAKEAAIKAVRDWLSQQPPEVKAMLIVDLFGQIHAVLWSQMSADTGALDHKLAADCGAWWTGQVLEFTALDDVAKSVYASALDKAREDADEPRLRIHDRHRSRTAWFRRAIEPPWSAPKEGPPIVVLYSFKGGLGRSTLLASFAIQRARLGERVCVLDFDLDSPGVGTLLSADAQGTTARWGVVDFLLERSASAAPLSDYYHRCDRVSGAGQIIVFPSGYVDEHYADKLARVDLEEAPEAHESGLWQLLTRVRDELQPRWILLDARTGISEPAGQLLSGIAHLHVLLGTTHEQSWQGLNRVLDRLGRDRVLENRPQADVLLVHAMVPTGEPGRVTKAQFAGRAEDEFDKRFYSASDQDADRFWTVDDKDSQDAPHVPLPVEYDSQLASFGDIAEIAELLCRGPYAAIAERMTSRFLEDQTS